MLIEDVESLPDDEQTHAMRAMWRARKAVFVDLLGWHVPVLADAYEIDQFDDEAAQYLILLDKEGRHRASARLLRTDRPFLLGTLYSHLCARTPPTGPTVREITRFCLDRGQSAAQRRLARDQLVTALVEHALTNGITDYVGVAECGWFEQVRRFGWECLALGQPLRQAGRSLIALHIGIHPDTRDRLRRGDIYRPLELRLTTTGTGETP